ncbi:uncharacterized protein MKZ38_008206 [Zalerion maritima]|uniref:Uncharacterized protein n=1 Tax=Zalerion maritima TaxID=339359 RepID=A0AAD5WMV6_9PEZI|nr:uncharacterized protein MKZ38_008206 [Zalerion maritima]
MAPSHLTGASILAAIALASALSQRQAGSTSTVDLSERYQTIDGFGFSEAFQRANGIVELPEPKRSEVVDLLFNATKEAGFTIMRDCIGSSPNSNLDWMDTILPEGPDSPDGELEYVWDGDDSGRLWVAQQGRQVDSSAPGFTKSNGQDSNGGGVCGSPGLYTEEGVEIAHLGLLNEPDITTNHASMRTDGAQATDFIWWEGTQDSATNNNKNEKLILVDGGDYEVDKRVWAHAQYSRAIRPGAARVGVSGGRNMKLAASENEDGMIAVNVISAGQGAAAFAVDGITAESATAWVTDTEHDMDETRATVGEDGSVGGITVPANGMVSVVIQPR